MEIDMTYYPQWNLVPVYFGMIKMFQQVTIFLKQFSYVIGSKYVYKQICKIFALDFGVLRNYRVRQNNSQSHL